jgi:multiple sugar transport system substrate-binding protein
MLRWTSVLLAMLCLSLAACGSDDSNGSGRTASTTDVADCDPKGVTLTTAYLSVQDAAMREAKAAIERRYAGLEVDAKPSSAASYDDLTQQIVADRAAGKEYDLISSGNNQIRFYVDTFDPLPFDAGVLPATYRKEALPIGTVGGKLFAVPAQVSTPNIIINEDLLREAGLDPKDPPATYSELFAAARKLRSVSDGPPVAIDIQAVEDWYVQAAVQSAGATFIAEDGTAGFGDEAGVAGLELYGTLGREKLAAPVPLEEAIGGFASGKTPIMFGGNSGVGIYQEQIGDKFDWTLAPMPIADRGEPRMPAGGNSWMVLATDDCRAAFASELVAELLQPKTIAKGLVGATYTPVDTEARRILKADKSLGPQAQAAYDYSLDLTPWGGWPGDSTPKVNQIIETMVAKLIRGAPVQPAVEEAVAAIDAEVQ